MSKQQHIILKVVFDIEIGEERLHKEIADEISNIFNDNLSDLLSEVLDDCSEAGELLRFPKISIDLGEVKRDDLYYALTEDVPELLRDEIDYKIRSEFIETETVDTSYSPDFYSDYSSSSPSTSYSTQTNSIDFNETEKPKRTRMLVPQAVMWTKALPKELEEKEIYSAKKDKKLEELREKGRNKERKTILQKDEIRKEEEPIEKESKALSQKEERKTVSEKDELDNRKNIEENTKILRVPAVSALTANPENRPTSIATYHAQIDAIVYFLKKGRLPDWIALGKVTIDELINRLFDQYPSIIGLRLKQMQKDETIRTRMIQQFSNETKERVELATGEKLLENNAELIPEHLVETMREMQELENIRPILETFYEGKNRGVDLLEYLVLNGNMPWWYQEKVDKKPENYIFSLSTLELSELFQRILTEDMLSKELAQNLSNNFSDRAIDKILQALFPDTVGFIKTVEIVLEESKLSKYIPIWTYIKRSVNTSFNLTALVSTVIYELAKLENTSEEKIVKILNATLSNKEEARYLVFKEMLEFRDSKKAVMEESKFEKAKMNAELLWTNFLEKGVSPLTIQAFSEEISLLLKEKPTFIIGSLRKLSLGHLIQNNAFGNLPMSLLQQIIKKLMPVRHGHYLKVINVMSSIAENSFIKIHAIDYASRVKEERFDIWHYIRDIVKMTVRKRIISPKIVVQELIEQLEKKTSDSEIRTELINNFKVLEQTVKVSKGLARKIEVVEKEKTEPTRIKYKDGILGEEVYIRNAGLVILWPFLTTYFSRLGMLTEEKLFKDEATASRAVHLLQFLATKFPASEEHELVLNKILCGIPIDAPIEYGIVLTKEEEYMSNSLLKAIISQWSALSNSSPDGLRGGFLIREGKLTKREKKWLLQVEKKSYDVLLGKMPWGVSMIKISWMPNMLTVEWT